MELMRILVSLAVMAAFAAIVWWAYAPSRKERWEERALLDEDDL
ncbi:MAG TPA: CcoQ/FixQ family Cbb3-type cytochrome c oxidase assembly chaperone [Burkholderiales bacterium]